MNESKHQPGIVWGISTRTSLISGLVVLLLLSMTALIIISMESNMIEFLLDSHISKTEDSFEKQANREEESLQNRHQINTEICSRMSSYFVYNFEFEGLLPNLSVFLELPDINAIQVTGQDKKPFAAVWKNGGTTQSGNVIPSQLTFNAEQSFTRNIMYGKESIGKIQLFYTDTVVVNQLKTDKDSVQTDMAVFRETINHRKNQDFLYQIIAFVFVVIALVATLFFLLKINVISPISGITSGMKDIAEGEGDLTKRLAVKKRDEIGELSSWFNVFIEKIQTIISELSGSANMLDTSSHSLSEISDSMHKGSSDALSKIIRVSQSSKQMSQNMDSVASASEEAANAINLVATSAEEMNATIKEISANTEKASTITLDAVSQSETASKQVDELGTSAKGIGKVLEAISEISEQVNLLALNATIEAARAGEAGKGFAVVANEIKELAKQTSEATGEISKRVTDIQASTGKTVTQIGHISSVVKEVNDIVSTIASAIEEQAVTTNEIAKNVSQVSVGIDDVNKNIVSSSTFSNEISKEIAEVSGSTEKVSKESGKIKDNSKELSNLANSLTQIVERFKI